MNSKPKRTPPHSYRRRLILPAVISLLLGAPAWAASEPPAEELIVFHRPDLSSAISDDFTERIAPEVKAVAEELEIPIRWLDAGKGTPKSVTITPLMVFQSARGRSFFQGRYADSGKLKHFIRTSRAIPAPPGTFEKDRVAVLKLGRAKIYAPLKITELAGTRPAGYQTTEFQNRARNAVWKGFQRFQVEDSVTFGPADRAFYLDVYPYRSEDGQLYISLAVFSQFNCVEPIYRSEQAVVSGAYDDLDRLFGVAARFLEKEVEAQWTGSEIGDGFDVIGADVPVVSWDSLGLALPKRQGSVDAESHSGSVADLPVRWRVADPESDLPRLIFRFPAPLERYSGEVSDISGFLALAEAGTLRGAAGRLRASTSSVTMGEDSLDNAIHKKMIKVADYPESRFELRRFLESTEDLAFGKASRFEAEGVFTLMGLDVPVIVRGDVEPIFSTAGDPLLNARATFEIRLWKPFEIAGPDGPEPARDTLKFFLDFLMEADPS